MLPMGRGEFFDLLFNSADLSKFAKEDKIKYENNMTTERDIRNQIAYARHEGKMEGEAKGREEATLAMAKKCRLRDCQLPQSSR